MIHIVFSKADATVLKSAIELDETLQGNLISIEDDYSIGPLENIYDKEGAEARKFWREEILKGGDFEIKSSQDKAADYETALSLVDTMKENETETIWIWAAQNRRDVSGYYWLLYFLKEFQGRIFILYLNNLPFINEKGNIFYPAALSEIPAKEFLKARKLAREITSSEFEVDPDEWTKIISENKGFRLLEGGKKLMQYEVDFLDNDIKKFVTTAWQKGSKVIHNYLAKAKHTAAESFLLWRLKELIAKDTFEVQGKIAQMKDFEIKWKSSTTE